MAYVPGAGRTAPVVPPKGKGRPSVVVVQGRKVLTRPLGTPYYVPGFLDDVTQAAVDRAELLGVAPLAVAGGVLSLFGKKQTTGQKAQQYLAAAQGGDLRAAKAIAEWAGQPALKDWATWRDTWQQLVVAAPAVAQQAYQLASVKPALVPAGAGPSLARPVTTLPVPAPSAPAAPTPTTPVQTPIGTMTVADLEALFQRLSSQNQRAPSWLSDVLSKIQMQQAATAAPPPMAPAPSVSVSVPGEVPAAPAAVPSRVPWGMVLGLGAAAVAVFALSGRRR